MWVKPEDAMKTAGSQRVALSVQALEVLAEAGKGSRAGLVFPGSRSGAMLGNAVMTQALHTAENQLKRLRKRNRDPVDSCRDGLDVFGTALRGCRSSDVTKLVCRARTTTRNQTNLVFPGDSICGVRGWRADLASRFQPLLSKPGAPASSNGLSSRIMRLAHGPTWQVGYASDWWWCCDIVRVRGCCTVPALRGCRSHPAHHARRPPLAVDAFTTTISPRSAHEGRNLIASSRLKPNAGCRLNAVFTC